MVGVPRVVRRVLQVFGAWGAEFKVAEEAGTACQPCPGHLGVLSALSLAAQEADTMGFRRTVSIF